MITRNTQSPAFGELRVHESYKKLGIQGERSLEIITPIADKLTEGFVTTIGSAPNPAVGGRPTLMVAAEEKITSGGIIGFFKKMLSFSCLSQSSTTALNPDLLAQNIVIPEEQILKETNKPLNSLHEVADDFFSDPEIEEKLVAFDRSFAKVPSLDDLEKDSQESTIIAQKNGYTILNPFGKD